MKSNEGSGPSFLEKTKSTSQLSEKDEKRIFRQEEMKEGEILPLEEVKSALEETKEKQEEVDYTDGRRIFINSIRFYPEELKSGKENPHMVSFRQLLFQNPKTADQKSPKTLQAAFFTTFVFDPDTIISIVESGVPVSVVIHPDDRKVSKSQYILSNPEKGAGFWLHQPKMHPIFNYGTFHPKLILLKFPQKVRVVITSANLRTEDWLYMGQVVWFQDFPLIREEGAIKTKKSTEFEEYLEWFLATLRPYGCKMTQLEFLNQINLSHYDFSLATVKLIASISGRFTDKVDKYGLIRLRSIIDEARRKRESTKKKENGRQTITFFN